MAFGTAGFGGTGFFTGGFFTKLPVSTSCCGSVATMEYSLDISIEFLVQKSAHIWQNVQESIWNDIVT